MSGKSFLFLQGVASPFFDRLGEALIESGHDVYKINFCGGDHFYWNNSPAWDFPGPKEALEPFIREKLDQNSIDNLLLFGDCRTIHRICIEEAKKRGIDIFVFEEGYVRPNWVTLEESGVNGNSSLPKDPDWYREIGPGLPRYENAAPVGPSMRSRAIHDMRYHLANFIYSGRYPGYKTHRPYRSYVEYSGWARRFSTLPYYNAQAKRITRSLIEQQKPYYVYPMQLNADAQIKNHSGFDNNLQAIEFILTSFANNTHDELLVIKNHPLDTGLIDYRHCIGELSDNLDINDRIIYIDGGHLPTLLDHTRGTVTVNSTVGNSAIFHQSPTIALGEAIYDIEGLTFQGDLDDFWHNGGKPDRRLAHHFRNAVIHFTQVNGGFYSERGIDMAVAGCMSRLIENHIGSLSDYI
jgi:capsular polysaccharide export protein